MTTPEDSPSGPAARLAARAAARAEREFAGLVRAYERAERDLRRDDEALFGRRPEISGWSVAEHRFHLCLASELVVRNLRSLRKGSGGLVKPRGEPIPAALPILERGLLPRGTRAPRMVTPPEEIERDFLAELIESGRAELLALAPDLALLAASSAVLPHQTLGDLSAPLWLRFGRMHAVHHQRIIAELDAARAPGRPR